MKTFYTDFDKMRGEKYDGMIITGAPVEQMDFEEVTYWDEITEIFDWARTHVTSTLYICWAAQAGLYHHYGVPKYALDKKMFGIFEHRTLQPLHPISVDLMICSMCRIAATRKCVGKIYRRFRN